MIDLVSGLTERQRGIVAGCLAATVQGKFFPEWEFQTLFGVDRSVVARVMTAWPFVDAEDWKVRAAVVGALNHLLGYPHGLDKELPKYMSASTEEVKETLSRLVELGLRVVAQRGEQNPTTYVAAMTKSPFGDLPKCQRAKLSTQGLAHAQRRRRNSSFYLPRAEAIGFLHCARAGRRREAMCRPFRCGR
jgi:hypothetical protein